MRTRSTIAAAGCVAAVATAVIATAGGDAHQTHRVRAATPAAPLVGRWERVNTCEELVRALKQYGLAATAPAMLAGNGYVPGTPEEIARRRNPCEGAVARRHSHFFRADGQFGSVDFDNNQVDNGPWRLANARTLQIGSPPEAVGTFRIRIRDGRLRLTPRITAAQKREALAHPLEFSSAGWMVAVAFPGHTWQRVPCNEWC
ncbi:MAG: hypothetical protein QOC68_4513 [Solirubrobacteraceae bacterium]|jgi:hypothetical protein|nr:hypothetical protein [Solirubrobacteraceae bacterium]